MAWGRKKVETGRVIPCGFKLDQETICGKEIYKLWHGDGGFWACEEHWKELDNGTKKS